MVTGLLIVLLLIAECFILHIWAKEHAVIMTDLKVRLESIEARIADYIAKKV